MPQKNTPTFTVPKPQELPRIIYRLRFVIALILAAVLLLSGCSKEALAEANKSMLEQYFEDNILNRDFNVEMATDNGTNITAQFSGYTFVLAKNTLRDGPMTATIGSTVLTGSWSANEDYSKLVISLPKPARLRASPPRATRAVLARQAMGQNKDWATRVGAPTSSPDK